MIENFRRPGRASFILGGQFGSEGKGAAAAYVASKLPNFSVVTANNGSQSGHTSIHNGSKRVLFHLPTYPVVLNDLRPFVQHELPLMYLNAGAIIDPDVLRRELDEVNYRGEFFIHPNAAVITDECKDAEMRADSAQTKIASTRKGVGEALARKVLRSGLIARDHPYLKQFVRRISLNERLASGKSVLVEVPQGHSLSLNGPFYPHCTSRDCSVMQAMSDAHIHPSFYGATMLVIRTFPIRVGNIYRNDAKPTDYPAALNPDRDEIGHSGDAYPFQDEINWADLGVEAEMTTVTKRVRRVFKFSVTQLIDALAWSRPTHVFVSFCDYHKTAEQTDSLERKIRDATKALGFNPQLFFTYGPATSDVCVDHPRMGF